MIVIILAVVR